jgi:signal transduction histidine kinase
MDPDSDPLHILIRTAGSGSAREIIVEDTGTGFDPDDSGEPHIAMDNIRHRLAMMCSGKLTVSPREGGGTVVRVTIPHAPVSEGYHT